MNTASGAVSDILAFVTSGVLLSFITFEKTLSLSFFIGLAGGLAICFMATDPGNQWIFPLCVLLAKFGISSAYNICYMANGLLFPTQIAATTLGICNLFARCATIFAPFVAAVFETPRTPMIIFSTIALLALIASFLLKKPKVL